MCKCIVGAKINSFMMANSANFELIWLQQYDGPAIYFYRRYVNDTFCLFNNEKDALEFFHYINDKQTP